MAIHRVPANCGHIDWPCCGCGHDEVLTGADAIRADHNWSPEDDALLDAQLDDGDALLDFLAEDMDGDTRPR